MAGVPGLTCPECGRAAKHERELGRPRRKWGLALASVMVLPVAIGAGLTPRVRHRGWMGAMPTWMLALAMNVHDPEGDPIAHEVWSRWQRDSVDGPVEGVLIERYVRRCLWDINSQQDVGSALLNVLSDARQTHVMSDMLAKSSHLVIRERGLSLARNRMSTITPKIRKRLHEIAEQEPSIRLRCEAIEAIASFPEQESHDTVVRVLENVCSPASMDAASADKRSAIEWEKLIGTAVAAMQQRNGLDAGSLDVMLRAVRSHRAARATGLMVLARLAPMHVGDVCEVSHRGPPEAASLMLQALAINGVRTPAQRECLLTHLTSSDPACREWAAWGLCEVGAADSQTFLALAAMMRAETSPQGQLSAFKALIKLRAPYGLINELACLPSCAVDTRGLMRAELARSQCQIPECLKSF